MRGNLEGDLNSGVPSCISICSYHLLNPPDKPVGKLKVRGVKQRLQGPEAITGSQGLHPGPHDDYALYALAVSSGPVSQSPRPPSL